MQLLVYLAGQTLSRIAKAELFMRLRLQFSRYWMNARTNERKSEQVCLVICRESGKRRRLWWMPLVKSDALPTPIERWDEMSRVWKSGWRDGDVSPLPVRACLELEQRYLWIAKPSAAVSRSGDEGGKDRHCFQIIHCECKYITFADEPEPARLGWGVLMLVGIVAQEQELILTRLH